MRKSQKSEQKERLFRIELRKSQLHVHVPSLTPTRQRIFIYTTARGFVHNTANHGLETETKHTKRAQAACIMQYVHTTSLHVIMEE